MKTIKALKNKRGVTIAECVIAMAVILIVSAAGLSLLKISVINSATDVKLTMSRVDVGNALEMFKACDEDETEVFKQYILSEGFETTQGDTEAQENTDIASVYVKQNGNVTVEITIEDNKFKAAVFTENGNTMPEVLYEKNQ